MTTARFRRLASAEEASAEAEEPKHRADFRDVLLTKLHALLWVGVSGAVAYYSGIAGVTLGGDERVNRVCLDIAVACLAANFVIMLYLTIWLPVVQRVTLPWEIYCPRLIPTSSVLSVASALLLVVAFWSVYGLLTPLIILVLAMGLLFTTHFIPWPC